MLLRFTPTTSACSWGAAFSSGSRRPSKKLDAKRWCSPGRFKWLHIRPSRLQPPSMLYYRSRDSFSPSCICMYRTLAGVQSALGFLLHEHLRFGSLWGPWPAGFLSLEVLFKSAPTHSSPAHPTGVVTVPLPSGTYSILRICRSRWIHIRLPSYIVLAQSPSNISHKLSSTCFPPPWHFVYSSASVSFATKFLSYRLDVGVHSIVYTQWLSS